jgi:regulator of cell morphogenesis and NO signaling
MTGTSSRVDWETAPLSHLIHFIVSRYHAPLRDELPALVAIAEVVEARHAQHASCPRGLGAHLA